MLRTAHSWNSRGGFTLVELSIVLVIIALVAGGILIGRDLIKAAQLRSIVSQLEIYDTASATFKAKYRCLPGDCIDALALGLGESTCPDPYNWTSGTAILHAGCNGNGDGKLGDGIAYAGCQHLYCPEYMNLWYHLSQAKLIPGSFDGKTASTTGMTPHRLPVFGVSAPATKLRDVGIDILTGQYYWLGLNRIDAGGDGYSLYPDEAHRIDVLMDDGHPANGRVGWANPIYLGCVTGDLMNWQATIRYNLTSTTARCGIYVKMALF